MQIRKSTQFLIHKLKKHTRKSRQTAISSFPIERSFDSIDFTMIIWKVDKLSDLFSKR
jgi:hypothetical protein